MSITSIRETIDCDTVAKWLFEISEIEYEIEHLPGKLNIFADALSRQTPDTVAEQWKQFQPAYIDPANMKTTEVVTPEGETKQCLHMHNKPTFLETMQSYPSNIRKKIMALQAKQNRLVKPMTGKRLPFNADTFTNDWKLNPSLFIKAQNKWGIHTIDLFAAAHNAQVQRFYTRRHNALSQSWKGENPWCNPPWHLISSVLAKLKREKVTATLCVPYYKNASWWSTLKSMAIDDPIALPRNKDTFLRRGTETIGYTPWDTTLLVRVSGNPKEGRKDNIDWSFEQYKQQQARKAGAQDMSTEIQQLHTVLTKVQDKLSKLSQDYNDPVEPMDWCSTEDTQNALMNAVTRSAAARDRQNRESDEPSDDHDDLVFGDSQELPILPSLGDAGAVKQYSYHQKWNIVRKYHCLGHQTSKTVTDLVRRTGKYDWSDTYDIAQDVENECLHCELKRNEPTSYHPLRSNRSQFAGDIWVIDLIQVPRYQDTTDDQAFILHVLDHWSGFSWLRPLENKTAANIAHHIVDIMSEHGFPTRFIHDNAKELTGTVMKDVIQNIANATDTCSAPYHAQTQGANERKHRQIKDSIIEVLNESPGRDWKRALPRVQMKTNLQVNRRHGSTPFAVYYGRTHNLFNTNDVIRNMDDWLTHIEKFDSYIIPQLNAKMHEYWDQQEHKFLKAHSEQTKEFERHQYVKVRVCGSKGQSSHGKLSYAWKGPFKTGR